MRGEAPSTTKDRQRLERYKTKYQFDAKNRMVLKGTDVLVLEDEIERRREVERVHLELNHAGIVPVYKRLILNVYWHGMKRSIATVVCS